MVNRLDGKVAAVTGAARGIGRSIAVAIAAEGSAVVVADIAGEEALAPVVREIQAAGGHALAVSADVSRRGDVEGMTDAAIDAFGTLDLLVNNAGVESIVPLLEMTEDEWERVTHTNLKGAFLCTQAAAKRMVASGRGGAIVNIGSVLSRVVLAGRTAYAPSKRAIAGLTANSAQELGVYGIRVNCIHPGFIDTDMTAWARNDPDALSQVLAKIAIERAGQPEDVAHAAVFLLSEDAAYITGTSIYVDGGFSL